MNRLILVYVKFPVPGRVKTRLAATVGPESAASIYRDLVRAVFGRLGDVESARVRVLFDPPEREEDVREWLGGLSGGRPLEFRSQVAGDLGERLVAGFKSAFDDGFDSVAAVGTDCIDLTSGTLDAAWRVLEEEGRAAVFGPTTDGGYYLVAMKRLHPELFREIPWSSRRTLEASLEAAERAGLDVGLLEEYSDVDDEAGWQAVKDRL